ncbi:MAG: hypothetical protein AAF456_12245 [Planctomycetota bacterium]
MRGRTVDTLLRQVEEWHSSLGRIKDLPKGEYEAALEQYRKAWDTREKELGRWHLKTQETNELINKAMKAKWQDASDHSN